LKVKNSNNINNSNNKNSYKDLLNKPIFFERNRVFRVYKGGKLFSKFFKDAPLDDFYPEEWIASYVKALNKDSKDPKEGVSKILSSNIYFDDFLKAYPKENLGEEKDLGILVKILDSAIRLPVQVHPDKAFSRKHFKSDYGKTETWIVLETRPDAAIYFGFKEHVTMEMLEKAVDKSIEDKNALEELLIKHPVEKGDVYFIPPRAVHAIGYGCLILEVQEPTDFTIQPEAWCGDYRLSEYEMYLGLDKKTALSCFDFSYKGKEAIKSAKVEGLDISTQDGQEVISLIDKKRTPCFSINKVRLENNSYIKQENSSYPKPENNSYLLKQAAAIYVIIEGVGLLNWNNVSLEIKKGDYFFIPHSLKDKCTISTKASLSMIECFKEK